MMCCLVFLQRGSDELLSSSLYNSPNSSMSGMVVTANGNDNKKLRVEDRMDCAPSRVLHIRKLPNEVSETEVIALGLPFGKVTNILMLKGKNQIFSKFGTVLKIITFTKNNQFQALLQFSDPMNAQQAKLALDGQNIYNACCTLRIDFSKLVNLNVKYNNDKSRDYTRPELPAGDGQPAMDPSVTAAFNKDSSLLGTPSGMVSPYSSGGAFSSSLSFGQTGGALSPLSAAAAAAAAAGRVALSGVSHSNSGVLLVSNLNEEVSVYGDAQRVKILYNKKDSALIQMADGNQAQLAMSHLNGQKMYGKIIRVTLSKHQTVQLPREGLDDQGLTKDFTNSPLHRFKKPGSKNFQNIFPPSATLHLSNIPQTITEEDLRTLFENSGGTVKAFKFFQCWPALSIQPDKALTEHY
ncbi:UNVERIFIED_CONTAM: hypothetical protein FKN15_048120 [Acipenser sinensis]